MELDAPIAAWETADGIAIRPFDRERDAHPVYATLAEAFAGHWGGTFDPFDQWEHEHIEGESSAFDAGLWFVALDRDEVVGAVCCRPNTARSEDAAYIDVLGVRRPWQGRGIGRTLLLAAFRELQHRRIAAVELWVDSENRTGATRLYEGVGMRAVRRAEWWEKEL